MTSKRPNAEGNLDPSTPSALGLQPPAAVDDGEALAVVGATVVYVRGRPAPQGSKRHVGRGRMVESSKAIAPWREAVRAECVAVLAGRIGYTEPVRVSLVFRTPRPRYHYGTGRNGARLRPAAPPWPAVAPDLDKLARGVLDGMTDSGLVKDDALVCELSALKTYALGGSGVAIVVQPMPGGS